MNRPGLVQPVGCGQVMSTGVGIALVAAGAIVRFAVPATFIHGLNPRVVGVIVMLAGVIALLLSLLVWGPLSRRRNHSGRRSLPRVPLRHGEGDKDHLTRLAALSLGAYAVGKKDLGASTMGLVTIALVVPACARDCDSGCSGPWRHLTT